MIQPQSPTLLSIISHARAGALDRAWEMFRSAGLDAETRDARVLSVKGRLLKDRARRASGEAQWAGYAAAANAYAVAADIDGSTYPLINAATLALLAGDTATAQKRAQEVLRRIEANPDEPETPFYKLATRAEALLLLGQEPGALALLEEAIAAAPRAWEDHASTLRQFDLILKTLGRDTAPLNAFRPPRAIHYAGHIFIGGREGEEALRRRVDAWLAQENIGFAYGALAAGADIVIAEAVLAAGGEIHVILPSSIEGFVARSVTPFGHDWEERFQALFERAETTRATGRSQGLPGMLDIALADRQAMGIAIMEAALLATSAAQLLVLSEQALAAEKPGASALAGQQWAALGLPQKTIVVERGPSVPSESASGQPSAQILAATLAVTAPAAGTASVEQAQAIHRAVDLLAAFAQPVPPAWQSDRAVFTFAEVADAVAAGAALVGHGFGVAADLLVSTPFADPLHEGGRLPHDDLAPLLGVAGTLLSTSFHATESFAAAAIAETGAQVEAQHVCEIELAGTSDPVVVYSLRVRSDDQIG